MPEKSSHAYYVDRRLSVARQQLSSLSLNAQTLNALQSQGLIDSALLQTYFAVMHYTNELLESYQHDVIKPEGFQLQQILLSYSHTVSELIEWRELASVPNSWLAVLVNLPSDLIACGMQPNSTGNSQASTLAQEGSTATKDSHLQVVLVDAEGEEQAIRGIALSQPTADWIVTECYQLIQQQREQLREY